MSSLALALMSAGESEFCTLCQVLEGLEEIKSFQLLPVNKLSSYSLIHDIYSLNWEGEL